MTPTPADTEAFRRHLVRLRLVRSLRQAADGRWATQGAARSDVISVEEWERLKALMEKHPIVLGDPEAVARAFEEEA